MLKNKKSYSDMAQRLAACHKNTYFDPISWMGHIQHISIDIKKGFLSQQGDSKLAIGVRNLPYFCMMYRDYLKKLEQAVGNFIFHHDTVPVKTYLYKKTCSRTLSHGLTFLE